MVVFIATVALDFGLFRDYSEPFGETVCDHCNDTAFSVISHMPPLAEKQFFVKSFHPLPWPKSYLSPVFPNKMFHLHQKLSDTSTPKT